MGFSMGIQREGGHGGSVDPLVSDSEKFLQSKKNLNYSKNNI
jgi:hypothetical protein